MPRQAYVRAMRRLALVAGAAASLAACAGGPRPEPVTGAASGTMRPYQVNGVWYRPAVQPHYDETGLASWYGPQSRYHTTANGERFDEAVASAAHRTLPLPCIVEVTNLDNGRRARLRVNDRGPFAKGRILDVSRRGAEDLGFLRQGMAHVRVRYVGPAAAGEAMLRAAPRPALQSAPVQEVRAEIPQEPSATVMAGSPRVQAATFAQRANAERAAADLSSVGEAVLVETDRGGQTLWRVVVTGRGGESVEALRQAVADRGFTGATAIGPS